MKSKEVLVSEEAGVISVRPRLAAALIIFASGAALGGALIALSVALAPSLEALASFARWGGAVIAGLSVLVLVAGLFAQATRGVALDFAHGVIRKGRTVYDRSVITDIVLKSSMLMDREVLTIVAVTRTGELILVGGHMPGYRLQMAETASKMKGLLGGTKAAAETGKTVETAPSLRRIPWLIAALVGIVISTTGAFMIPDLVLTRPPATFGVLFWPVGIWIAIPGILGLTGVMDRGFLRGKTLHGLLIAAWVVSYLIICFRRLG